MDGSKQYGIVYTVASLNAIPFRGFFFILALPNFKCGFAASGPLEDIALRVLRVLQSETMEAALMRLGGGGLASYLWVTGPFTYSILQK